MPFCFECDYKSPFAFNLKNSQFCFIYLAKLVLKEILSAQKELEYTKMIKRNKTYYLRTNFIRLNNAFGLLFLFNEGCGDAWRLLSKRLSICIIYPGGWQRWGCWAVDSRQLLVRQHWHECIATDWCLHTRAKVWIWGLKMPKRKRADGSDWDGDQSTPIPIQTFLWRQSRFDISFSRKPSIPTEMIGSLPEKYKMLTQVKKLFKT